MKEWRVYAKAKPGQSPGIIITWPEREDYEAREWFKEHQTDKPDHFYFGMTLELVEFETREERIERELRARVAELESLLEHILNGFSFQGHPGDDCHRTDWTSDKTLANWRDILNRK